MSYRPDTVVAKQTSVEFTPHPEGQFAMVCVDCISLGDRLNTKFGSISPTVVLVFQSGEVNEVGRLHDVTREFSISMGKKANLRAFLSQWRGRTYTEDEARKGVELHKMVGHPGLVSVEHKVSVSNDRTYANIISIGPLPKAMSAPELPSFERPPYFAEKAARYAEELRNHTPATSGAPPTGTLADMPAALAEENDDLPF